MLATFTMNIEEWIANINFWWCNDLSILIALVGFAASIIWNLYTVYQSRQVKLNVTGDISPSDNSKIQITISNVGKVNTRLGKIGIEFYVNEKWYKPKSGGGFESLYLHESLKTDPILGAGETVRVYMNLSSIKRNLESIALDDYKKEALNIRKISGWIYLARNKLKTFDDEFKKFEDELNDSRIKRFSINFSEILISTIKEHINSCCKKQI
ncbi:MAG: hypothetical protein A4S08_08945 [Proteobacteria bacterium SG_bin4]|nr:MAG: hypothetical protein A4S08_08945 [Proteobacteria bacterium SG_bin4]